MIFEKIQPDDIVELVYRISKNSSNQITDKSKIELIQIEDGNATIHLYSGVTLFYSYAKKWHTGGPEILRSLKINSENQLV